MDDLRNGERQVAASLDGIRRDHVARYQFAAGLTGERDRVLDFACGIGYGASFLAGRCEQVTAIDRSAAAIAYGRKHYSKRNLEMVEADEWALPSYKPDSFDTAVCFETIEHIEDPLTPLSVICKLAKNLVCSVPNEEKFPHGGRIKYHYRHYRRHELQELLEKAGYDITGWYGQAGPTSEVEEGVNGRTIVVTAKRRPARRKPNHAEFVERMATPDHVCILALGPSLESYVDHVKRLGARKAFADEVWGINAVGDIIQCDRVFHMDDVRVQEIRAAANPNGNIAPMLGWLKTHPGPIYTSRKVEGYPGLVEFPLQDVINHTGEDYFNSTVAYAVAYAIFIGVKKISLFGVDFAYPSSFRAEQGRGCVEFWIGIAKARGIRIAVPEKTALLDTILGWDAKFYGYDAVRIKLETVDGQAVVTFEDRELPSAEEIERRYDHSRHPNAHVSQAMENDNAENKGSSGVQARRPDGHPSA